ncbi:unnamed protein product [Bursaphelenchus okinawaensis]|uniref:DUF1768 domain-containing protein n=1 Tax=Bursaphelenchus okinawaensis TaxID=465554 RepID=A0A811K0R0_9BILA|nr:unnamed protein product [Bursaphelenchus okinawaensis]CAG9088794.1 unnamed protein product [Bursaphelenchus okinawaensis]
MVFTVNLCDRLDAGSSVSQQASHSSNEGLRVIPLKVVRKDDPRLVQMRNKLFDKLANRNMSAMPSTSSLTVDALKEHNRVETPETQNDRLDTYFKMLVKEKNNHNKPKIALTPDATSLLFNEVGGVRGVTKRKPPRLIKIFPVSTHERPFYFSGLTNCFTPTNTQVSFQIDDRTFISIESYVKAMLAKELRNETENIDNVVLSKYLRSRQISEKALDSWLCQRGFLHYQRAILYRLQADPSALQQLLETDRRVIIYTFNRDCLFGSGVVRNTLEDYWSDLAKLRVCLRYPTSFPLTATDLWIVPKLVNGYNLLGSFLMAVRHQLQQGRTLESLDFELPEYQVDFGENLVENRAIRRKMCHDDEVEIKRRRMDQNANVLRPVGPNRPLMTAGCNETSTGWQKQPASHQPNRQPAATYPARVRPEIETVSQLDCPSTLAGFRSQVNKTLSIDCSLSSWSSQCTGLDKPTFATPADRPTFVSPAKQSFVSLVLESSANPQNSKLVSSRCQSGLATSNQASQLYRTPTKSPDEDPMLSYRSTTPNTLLGEFHLRSAAASPVQSSVGKDVFKAPLPRYGSSMSSNFAQYRKSNLFGSISAASQGKNVKVVGSFGGVQPFVPKQDSGAKTGASEANSWTSEVVAVQKDSVAQAKNDGEARNDVMEVTGAEHDATMARMTNSASESATEQPREETMETDATKDSEANSSTKTTSEANNSTVTSSEANTVATSEDNSHTVTNSKANATSEDTLSIETRSETSTVLPESRSSSRSSFRNCFRDGIRPPSYYANNGTKNGLSAGLDGEVARREVISPFDDDTEVSSRRKPFESLKPKVAKFKKPSPPKSTKSTTLATTVTKPSGGSVSSGVAVPTTVSKPSTVSSPSKVSRPATVILPGSRIVPAKVLPSSTVSQASRVPQTSAVPLASTVPPLTTVKSSSTVPSSPVRASVTTVPRQVQYSTIDPSSVPSLKSVTEREMTTEYPTELDQADAMTDISTSDVLVPHKYTSTELMDLFMLKSLKEIEEEKMAQKAKNGTVASITVPRLTQTTATVSQGASTVPQTTVSMDSAPSSTQARDNTVPSSSSGASTVPPANTSDGTVSSTSPRAHAVPSTSFNTLTAPSSSTSAHTVPSPNPNTTTVPQSSTSTSTSPQPQTSTTTVPTAKTVRPKKTVTIMNNRIVKIQPVGQRSPTEQAKAFFNAYNGPTVPMATDEPIEDDDNVSIASNIKRSMDVFDMIANDPAFYLPGSPSGASYCSEDLLNGASDGYYSIEEENELLK